MPGQAIGLLLAARVRPPGHFGPTHPLAEIATISSDAILVLSSWVVRKGPILLKEGVEQASGYGESVRRA